MRWMNLLIVACVLATFSFASARVDLEDPSQILKVLGEEPPAANQPRFAQVAETVSVSDSPAFVSPTPDTITFKENVQAPGSSSNSGDDSNIDTSEFDAQLEKVNADIKKLEEAIAEEKECYKRLKADEARVRALTEQQSRIEREKEKKILETKLEQQLKDQHDLRHMVDRLKSKANELRRTQNIITGKIIATRKAIHSIDQTGVEDDDSTDPAEILTDQLDLYHQQKEKMVKRSNTVEKSKVKGFIRTIAEAGKEELKAEAAN